MRNLQPTRRTSFPFSVRSLFWYLTEMNSHAWRHSSIFIRVWKIDYNAWKLSSCFEAVQFLFFWFVDMDSGVYRFLGVKTDVQGVLIEILPHSLKRLPTHALISGKARWLEHFHHDRWHHGFELWQHWGPVVSMSLSYHCQFENKL